MTSLLFLRTDENEQQRASFKNVDTTAQNGRGESPGDVREAGDEKESLTVFEIQGLDRLPASAAHVERHILMKHVFGQSGVAAPRMSDAERADRYISRIHSVQGQNGSASCFRAACILAEGFSLAEGDVRSILTAWNRSHAEPKWSEGELEHKISDAMREAQTSKRLGYLLQSTGGGKPPPDDWQKVECFEDIDAEELNQGYIREMCSIYESIPEWLQDRWMCQWFDYYRFQTSALCAAWDDTLASIEDGDFPRSGNEDTEF